MRPIQSVLSVIMASLCSAALAGPVNVNTADAETLARELNGVGLAKARAIVAYREAHGPFADVADLAAVKGIGVRLIEKNLRDVLLTDPE